MGGFVTVDLSVVGKEQFPFPFDGPAEDQGGFGVLDVRNVMGEGLPEDPLTFDGLFLFQAVHQVEPGQSFWHACSGGGEDGGEEID